MSFSSAVALRLIQAYRLAISPLFPPSCRYAPTCSEYCYDAIAEYGLLRGGWLGIKRIARCHPFHPGGVDPVPEIATGKAVAGSRTQQTAADVGRAKGNRPARPRLRTVDTNRELRQSGGDEIGPGNTPNLGKKKFSGTL